MSELEPRLSEADAQKVLARASELQAQGAGTLSVTQLREIATEMSIPDSAFDQAMLEFRRTTLQAPIAAAATPAREPRRGPHPVLLATAALGTTVAALLGTIIVLRMFP